MWMGCENGDTSLHIIVNRDPTLKGRRRCILKYQVGLLLVQIALHWLSLRCWLVQVERSKVMVSFGSGSWAGIYSVSWLLSWSRVIYYTYLSNVALLLKLSLTLAGLSISLSRLFCFSSTQVTIFILLFDWIGFDSIETYSIADYDWI